MITVTAKLIDRGEQTFGGSFTRRIRQFEKDVKIAQQAAAKTATDATRARVTYLRPPVPQRPGRRTTQGHMGNFLVWKPNAGSGVEFDMQMADAKVPYWIIQEVGTGKTATFKQPGTGRHDRNTGNKNPRGRQAAGSGTQRKIPSQIGRAIPSSLAFGTGPTGQYVPFGQGAGQGLFLRRRLKGAPSFAGKSPMVTISKEIEGKHMVRDGGKEGFRQYRRLMLAAAKSSFNKPNTGP